MAARKYNLSLHGVLNRTHVGLAELRQLIDQDMVSTPRIELAEQHQLAWCIGRVCAVRPGSIGRPEKGSAPGRLQFLAWRDVTITRSLDEPGMFIVKLVFRNAKGGNVDLQKASETNVNKKPLECVIMPPKNQHNLIFSIAHRLLIIALRRDLIVGIKTIDELLEGHQYNILVRKSMPSISCIG